MTDTPGEVSPVPGSAVPCRHHHCRRLVIVGRDAIPAWKLTGYKWSRGFYCEACYLLVGGKVETRPPRAIPAPKVWK